MSRTWEPNDPVCEHRGGWRKGVVASVDPSQVAIRWDGAELVSFRSPSDEGLVDPEQVPIDDRHWLPESVRDQLVRQEAAGRLRAMSERLVGAGMLPAAVMVDDIADRFDDLTDGFAPLHLALAARALLAPAPQPATAP